MGQLTQEMLEHNLMDPAELMQVRDEPKLHLTLCEICLINVFFLSPPPPPPLLRLSGGLLHGGVSLPSAG